MRRARQNSKMSVLCFVIAAMIASLSSCRSVSTSQSYYGQEPYFHQPVYLIPNHPMQPRPNSQFYSNPYPVPPQGYPHYDQDYYYSAPLSSPKRYNSYDNDLMEEIKKARRRSVDAVINSQY